MLKRTSIAIAAVCFISCLATANAQTVVWTLTGTIDQTTGLGQTSVGDPFTVEITLENLGTSSWTDVNSDPSIGSYVGVLASGKINFFAGSFKAGDRDFGAPDNMYATVTNGAIDSILFEPSGFSSNAGGNVSPATIYLEFSSAQFLSSDDMPASVFAESADLSQATVTLGSEITGTITSVFVDVQPDLESLIQDVEDCNLANGLSNSLDSKLENAMDALLADIFLQRQDVANKLNAFVNAVEAQRGNKIPDADADYLVAQALNIVAKL